MSREQYSNPLTTSVEEIKVAVDDIEVAVDAVQIAVTDVQTAVSTLQTTVDDIPNLVGVKSIQKGTVTFPNDTTVTQDVTISAVDTSKSYVLISSTGNDSGNSGRVLLTARIINSTTVRIERGTTNGTATGDWQVIENK